MSSNNYLAEPITTVNPVIREADLLSALESIASDLPESDPQLPDRIWLNGGVFTFTGTTGLVGDLLVGTAFVS